MARFLTGRSVNLSHTFLEDETALTPATVNVTVTRDGASTPAVSGPATPSGNVYTLSAGILPEGVYTVKWDGNPTAIDFQEIETVGGFLFEIPEIRSDPDFPQAKYPAVDIRSKREQAENDFQRITGRSFTPRTVYLVLDVDTPSCGMLPVRDVRSVKVFDSTGAELAAPTLDFAGPFAFLDEIPDGAYSIEVAYGFSSIPSDINRVGKLWAKALLLEQRSGIPDRATSFQPADGGTYTLATPGRAGYKTGIPDVDAVLKDYTFEIADSVGVA